MLDSLTRSAIVHTGHCLLGCGIGEVIGMAIGQSWNNIAQTATGIVLAFTFGYALTYLGARRKGIDRSTAINLAISVDTVSIVSMVAVDNTIEWLIPGAINAHLVNFIFWWSEALALTIAFIITVPVNRFMMSRRGHMHHH